MINTNELRELLNRTDLGRMTADVQPRAKIFEAQYGDEGKMLDRLLEYSLDGITPEQLGAASAKQAGLQYLRRNYDLPSDIASILDENNRELWQIISRNA